MGSFTQKLLRARLFLPLGAFAAGGNTLTLTNLKMTATIVQAARWQNSLDLNIYGMAQADMNQVSILWSAATPTAVAARALISLEATNDGVAWTQVFSGQFIQAAPDYRSPPEVNLTLQAITGNGMQLAIAAPTSYPGATSIAQIAAFLAGKMGFAFENNGVTGNLRNPYFPGTLMDQFKQLCEHANIDYYFDGNATLAVCPANQARTRKQIPVLSKATGLIGYPTIQQYGQHVDALWQPALTVGGPFEITGSPVPGANGRWFPFRTVHTLEAWAPEGSWFSSMDCLPTGAA